MRSREVEGAEETEEAGLVVTPGSGGRHRIQSCNRAFSALSGHPRESLAERTLKVPNP